jgi:glycosyltransferase involved in cell wall biosynthesis
MLSIVVDNYNYERFLKRAIESALAQTYPHVEVVVVDDGSTDGSRQLVAGFRDRVIAVEQANAGQAAAINAGFAACRGDIVIFLDADDELYPRAAERVVQRFRAGVAKLHFRLDAVDQHGRLLGFTNPPASQPLPQGTALPSLLRTGGYVTPVMSGNAFTREVLERILPIPEAEWRIAADGYLVTAAPFYGTIVSIEERLGAYRIHGSNAWAPDTIDAANLPRRVAHDLDKYALIRMLAAANGLSAARNLERNDHSHLRHRIASLRLSPRSHPIPQDRLWRLAWWGAIQTVFHSDLDARRRITFVVWFATVAFAPRAIATRAILLLYVPQRRQRIRRARANKEASRA